ncbi:hypothetical protein sscle_05g043850 [Sclerotinia sclerotiorum 1980 UF-70]|uniref:Uncharacterized protein n=1 Tax=Sclerotinia sclerotiorum (strain ATCC 18683 / 1980 / Ss-1) TaxID=665079 RepID=A0A1D9Q3U8_SCLS1|nr:hypothetical protein sscle_05g043850 [Sclerotinia sclerotiorum 1980 UF-70]
MGKKVKSKTNKANQAQDNGGKLQVARGVSGSKKGSIWKQPAKLFVPAAPDGISSWVWPSLPTVTTDAQPLQKSETGGSSSKTASDTTDTSGSSANPVSIRTDPTKIVSSSALVPSFKPFILKYHTSRSVPANGSSWENPPLPSRDSSIKQDTSELDLGSWIVIPENAKWSSLPIWAATATSPASFKQKSHNDVVGNLGWVVEPEVVIEKDPKEPNPWADTTAEISTEPKEKFPTLVNWPFIGEKDRFNKLASLGLFVFNYKNNIFKQPKNDQNQSALIRLLQMEGLNDILLKLIWQNHSTASALCRTSQRSWDVLMGVTGTWDITGGNFENCEIPREENNFEAAAASVVIVTPTRDGKPIKYINQVKNLNKMCIAMHNFSEFLQNIQFHHVPFLSTHILALIIPEMRKLSVLGVHNCELIHLGDGQELLNIIQRDRLRGCEHQVSLDFYPAYHVGPYSTHHAGEKKGEQRLGEQYSYGVTWDDPGMVVADIRIAIWQEVHGLLHQARIQGIDFESKHTMLRQWLDKSPCLAVEKTLEVLMDPDARIDQIIVHVAYREFHGDVEKFRKSVPGKVANKPEGSQWMVEGFRCPSCEQLLPGIWFSYQMIRNFKLNSQDNPTCQACKLFDYLKMEDDHYKKEKRTIIKAWCWDRSLTVPNSQIIGDWNTNNLLKFLRVFKCERQGSHVRQLARLLDKKRRHDESIQIFHETDEVQRPINHQALGRRGAYGIRAATVQDKEGYESGRIDKEWDCFREDRINAHGQPATSRGR